MGKSKGKIGNVVTTTLKGQVIAKSRNYSPENPNSDGQKLSRGKMANAVKAWQFLALFLVFTKPFAKSTESTYNAFIRVAKNLFAEPRLEFGYLAAASLGVVSIFQSMIATVQSVAYDAYDVTVTLSLSGVPWSPNLKYRILCFDNTTGENNMLTGAISQIVYNSMELQVASELLNPTNAVCYIYDSESNKCSNVCFGEI